MPEPYDIDLSPVDPPGQDPDVDPDQEHIDVDCDGLREAEATEQDQLDGLDPDYREVD